MSDCPHFHVKNQTLLAIAGSVWLAAGWNVARIGFLAYGEAKILSPVSVLLSLAVFLAFGLMFLGMSRKHARRIRAFAQKTKPFWHFFDKKSYLIMALMMGGGLWLRSSGLAPARFLAVFYSGLGCALALAGLSFWQKFLTYGKSDNTLSQ